MATVFKINPEPTFPCQVDIPVAGGEPMELELEFRHKTKDEAKDWFNSFAGRSEAECLADIIAGWSNCDVAYSREALDTLLQNYAQAGSAILTAYARELTGARLGN